MSQRRRRERVASFRQGRGQQRHRPPPVRLMAQRTHDHELVDPTYRLKPVGWVESPLTDRAAAPKQGDEGSPLARVIFRPESCEAARDLREGDEVAE
jgi:hypothetical protein